MKLNKLLVTEKTGGKLLHFSTVFLEDARNVKEVNETSSINRIGSISKIKKKIFYPEWGFKQIQESNSLLKSRME